MAVPPSVFVYMGNLADTVTVPLLVGLLMPLGNVIDVRIERDPWSGVSLQYGRLMFDNAEHAEDAIRFLNRSTLEGKPLLLCRYGEHTHELHHYQRSLTLRGILKHTTNTTVRARLADVEHILSIERVEKRTRSRYAEFMIILDSTSAARTAREQLHLQRWNKSSIKATPFKPNHREVLRHIESENRLSNTSELYVENLPPDVDEDQMVAAFRRYGRVRRAVIFRSNSERPVGWIQFATPADVQHVVHRWESNSM